MCDGGDPHHGEGFDRVIVTGMIAEWAFGGGVVGMDPAFDHDFSAGRDEEWHGFRVGKIRTRAAQDAAKGHF